MADETSAYMVRGSWLKKVDEALNNPPPPEASRASSVFYDVRPALLKSAWAANAAGLYCATACFIINDVADASFVFPICAPTATSKPAGSANSSKFFVIWRGRWEVLQPEKQSATAPTYTGGSGISIYRNPGGEDYIVDNRGAVYIDCGSNSTFYPNGGPIRFNPAYFQLISDPAVVGGKLVSLKTS